MDPILEQFLSEARENLSYLDQHLGDLENGDDETVNALFRAAHTLKGGAGLVGFTAVKEITHAAEDLLDAYRNHKVSYSPELVDTLYDAFDEVVEYVDAAEESGSVNIETDLEKIEELKQKIRSFLVSESKSEPEVVEAPFEVDNNLAIAELFSHVQAFRVLSEGKDSLFASQEITNEMLQSDTLWLMDMDLDTETLEQGNDPVYLFYLLGQERIKAVSVQPVNCEVLSSEPHLWITRIVAIIEADATLIEDTFYNIIEEIRFRPLSIDALFACSCEPLEENDTLDEFKQEIFQIVSSGDFEMLDEKLSAITQLLNPNSMEGFILTRLQALLPAYPVGSKEYVTIIHTAMKLLGIELPDQTSKTDAHSVKNSKPVKNDQKSIAGACSILKAQKKVLELSQPDSNLLERTKLLLRNVLGFLGIEDSIDAIDSVDKLKEFVEEKIVELEGESVSQPTTVTNESESKNSTSMNDLSHSINEQENKTEQVNQKKRELPIQKTKREQTSAASNISKTVKIEQHQIDELMDIVGELLVMKNALPYIADQILREPAEYTRRELLSKYEQISRITDRLQDRVMGMRLLPLSYIFGRYPKLVRELSKKLGKKIRYEEEGGDTKLDKTVIEKLADPMIHIIRNSLDHGLETEEERIAAGKDPVGTLKISASSEGDKVFITITDDGRGIDVDKVVMKALEKGLVSPDIVDSLSKEERLKLIFEPGLSTKEEVTELSGRGVGTDAVKSTIEELGGAIRIWSELGKGTETTFELPLSVALTNVFHVTMNSINYAIAMDYVVETEKRSRSEIKTAGHKPFIRIRGELVPLLFEPVLLGSDQKDKEEISIVIVQNGERKFGLVVDDFVGQLDVVQKPLSGAFASHPFITGTSLLGNGDVLFIIDPRKLAKV